MEQLLNSAFERHRSGDLVAAEPLYRQALAAQPQNEAALHLLGVLLGQRGDFNAAADSIYAAIAINPTAALYRFNLGEVLRQAQKTPEANAAYQAAIDLDPALVEARVALANLFWQEHQPQQAILHYKQALALRPESADIRNNLGVALSEMGEFQQSLSNFEHAVRLMPANPEVHWNLAQALLRSGDWARGWQEFEWRLRVPRLRLARRLPQPRWHGEDIAGKTILLFTEGGLGDALNFVRYVPLVKDRDCRIILECQPALMSLFSSIPGIEQVLPRGQTLPPFDWQIPLQSLPLVFETTLETIPASVPYLKIPNDVIQRWQQQMNHQPGLKVGLAWAGAKMFRDPRPSSLSVFSHFASLPNINFYSLQQGAPAADQTPDGLHLERLLPTNADFTQTAGLIMNLDLVISVDTSVAHLAGALARPVWTMIPLCPDFRWLLNRHDTPWYPTMRLFRQQHFGDWGEVVQQIKTELSKFAP